MKLPVTVTTFFMALLLLCSNKSEAQTFEDAGQYISYVSKANEELTATYLSYLSAVAHNKSARKVEKRRGEVVEAITNTRMTVMGLSPWKGDRTFKDTTVAYLKILNSVFNEDYGKIVNMEEIAEQSYDAMEAYMLAQQKADEKLEEARLRQSETTKRFAAKYHINLIEGESAIGEKSKIANAVTKHYNEVYLIFFKSYKQEAYLMEAVNKKNIIAIEQNINSLGKFAKEGMEKLKTITGYNNDPVLIDACREALEFYQSEAERAKAMTDFFLKTENFEKMKKAFESKRGSDKTKADIDQFNESVKDINAATKEYNNLNQQLNKERDAVLNNWNKKSNHYMDDNMPVQKKQ